LVEGDANSKYFHSVLSSQRTRNVIVSLMVNGSLVEGVQPIRQTVLSHFRYHFADSDISRPGVENLAFKNLFYVDGNGLIKLFSIDEVKTAIWDCDNYKSPGPDGVHFGFIKEFWEVVKGDIM